MSKFTERRKPILCPECHQETAMRRGDLKNIHGDWYTAYECFGRTKDSDLCGHKWEEAPTVEQRKIFNGN